MEPNSGKLGNFEFQQKITSSSIVFSCFKTNLRVISLSSSKCVCIKNTGNIIGVLASQTVMCTCVYT